MTGGQLPGVLIAAGSLKPEPWAAPFRAHQPDRPISIWPELRGPDEIRYLLAWSPPAEAVEALPNLEAIFSLGAGVDHVVTLARKRGVPLVRVVDPDLTTRMREWVVLQVLLHHRRHLDYAALQAKRSWRELRQPVAASVRVGIMGLGELGTASALALAGLGFRVAGWSRSPKSLPGIETFAGERGLPPFLARTDILVCLLPLTDDTRGILARPLFERLAQDGALGGPVLVNGGRGGLQVEADILDALDAGVLKAASLDVFETEPLPPESPFWSRTDVVVTPHAAASSDPAVLAEGILRQILDHEAGRPLRNLVDLDTGY